MYTCDRVCVYTVYIQTCTRALRARAPIITGYLRIFRRRIRKAHCRADDCSAELASTRNNCRSYISMRVHCLRARSSCPPVSVCLLCRLMHRSAFVTHDVIASVRCAMDLRGMRRLNVNGVSQVCAVTERQRCMYMGTDQRVRRARSVPG